MEEELLSEEVEGRSNGSSSVFSELKSHCLDLLSSLSSHSAPAAKTSTSLSRLLHLLRSLPSDALDPYLDYTMFPLLLLLDAAIECRSQRKVDPEEQSMMFIDLIKPHKISDSVAEIVLQCLEELLKKCYLVSVDQMVVVLKKLTYGALLSPSEAAEEFREGVIRCIKALLLNLRPCHAESCSCKIILASPALLASRDTGTLLTKPSKCDQEQKECLLAFLCSQNASAAVGHWLSLLLKAADTEAKRGHRGSAKLRVEALLTFRVLVAKVGTADALAFFLPGVVSQLAKVLHVSKVMLSGAAGSVDAIDQAVRGLAEFLMIVLADDANLSDLDLHINVITGFQSNKDISSQSFLEELRHLAINTEGQSEIVSQELSGELAYSVTPQVDSKEKKASDSGNLTGSLHVNRTKEWVEKTAEHVAKLLCATFPHICIHPAKKVRLGLLSGVGGLLSKCSYSLMKSRLMLLECLCGLVCDDCEEVSAAAQKFLEDLFSSSEKHHLEREVAEIFIRLIEKLPKMVLGSEESLALSHAQQLLAVIYYSGPQIVADHLLQSPITAARLLDAFALCLSQNSVFSGSLNKCVLARPSSAGHLQSIVELNSGGLTSVDQSCVSDTAYEASMFKDKDIPNVRKDYELPRMPPWFIYVGSQKLYQALSGILRLVGLSLLADYRNEKSLSIIIGIPLETLRKLVSEIRMKECNDESWQSWYSRTGSGQLLRQASTAACILNEMIFGMSDKAIVNFMGMFQKSRLKVEDLQGSNSVYSDGWHSYKIDHTMLYESPWKICQTESARSYLIDCVGSILHEYLSPEVWDLPLEQKSSSQQPNDESEVINVHFFQDTAMLHQVIIDGIGIFTIGLGNDFASSGFLHSSLYLLLENLICSNFQIRSAADAVLHVLAATSGHPTVGQLVVANADYIIDSICRQLRHLDLNPHVPNVLGAMLSYIGVAHKILPLLEEPMRSVSLELEILGRCQHPNLTIPFLKALAEIIKASKHEASSVLTDGKSFSTHVKSKLFDLEKEMRRNSSQSSGSNYDDDFKFSPMESDMVGAHLVGIEKLMEQLETILCKMSDSRRYRRTVGSIATSCLTATIPLLASVKQAACLVALDVVEDGILTLAKVEEAYGQENETKEAIEQGIKACSFYHLQDALDAVDEADENRLLPAMNKIWPFLVVCVRNKRPVVVRRCLGVVSSVVQICGGDFFSRRFHTDGPHFWKLLTTSPFQKKSTSKEEKGPLQLPYRSISSSSDDLVAEVSNMKVQVAMLNMIADVSKNPRSASALEAVLKKVSGLVVGIACSGVTGLCDASVNALVGLASMDPDLIWLLLADIYYSMKKEMPSPPSPDFPGISQILPPPSNTGYLHVQYGGRTFGFDVDLLSVETVFKKLHSLVFTSQI